MPRRVDSFPEKQMNMFIYHDLHFSHTLLYFYHQYCGRVEKYEDRDRHRHRHGHRVSNRP